MRAYLDKTNEARKEDSKEWQGKAKRDKTEKSVRRKDRERQKMAKALEAKKRRENAKGQSERRAREKWDCLKETDIPVNIHERKTERVKQTKEREQSEGKI